MTEEDDYVALRFIESLPGEPDAEVSFHLEASVRVSRFSGRRAFFVREELMVEFAYQLDAVVNRTARSAKLECGLVAGGVDVMYFACQCDREQSDDWVVVHVSLGTGGSNGLLQRLHVALRLTSESLERFAGDFSSMAFNRRGEAVLRSLTV